MPHNSKVKRLTPATVLQVNALLVERYGQREAHLRDPLDGLILILLSQATADVNSNRAFLQLKSGFPTWDAVLSAPLQDIVKAIEPAGLANQKAARIVEILLRIKTDHGILNLDWLHNVSAGQAKEYLESFNGVGPKTAACVLLFYLGMPAFPVDTHVLRITRRMGWIGPKASAEKAHLVLDALVPDECKLNLHINFIAHGRTLCRPGPRGPYCLECPIRPFCAYGMSMPPEQLKAAPATKAGDRDPDFFITIKQRGTVS